MKEMEELKGKNNEKEISLNEIFEYLKKALLNLRSKWFLIFLAGLLGSSIGFIYAFYKKPIYTANLSFALEDEKSGGGAGLAGAMGLASSLGIDLGGNAGGAFNGANLIELLKSRTLVERALLNPINVNGEQYSLASYYLKINELDKGWENIPRMKTVRFDPLPNRAKFSLQQDSILGILYSTMTSADGPLSVIQKDKKVSILNIQVKSTNELFAKSFTESIAKEVSEFYIDTKSKKARMNVSILQKQADSIRSELNEAITGVAAANDNVYNLNSALMVKRAPSARRQVDVQANTAILTQLVANLEMAKVALLKETPLIQVIDKPILPLAKEKTSKLKGLIFGFLITSILMSTFLTLKMWSKSI
jgi:hypothetical protein